MTFATGLPTAAAPFFPHPSFQGQEALEPTAGQAAPYQWLSGICQKEGVCPGFFKGNENISRKSRYSYYSSPEFNETGHRMEEEKSSGNDQASSQEKEEKQRKVKPVKETLQEYGRGIAGGLLFSLPLLYTIEVWWRGFTAPPAYLLVAMGVTYLLLLGYNRFAGMQKNASWLGVAKDSVEEFGLGLVVSFLVLWLLNRVNFEMPLNEILGKVILEGMIVAIGISVGTAQLGQSKGNKGKGGGDKKGGTYDLLHDVTLSGCGAVLFASSVAPTEEIEKLAISSGKENILLMIFLSLGLCAVILFFSDFTGAAKKRPPMGKMAFDLVISYSVALAVSLGLMWFFGRIEGSLLLVASEMVVLGIPASIGASAGRLLISS